jgi:hypothetical protein
MRRASGIKWQTFVRFSFFPVGKICVLNCHPWKCRKFYTQLLKNLAPYTRGNILEILITQTPVFHDFVTGPA